PRMAPIILLSANESITVSRWRFFGGAKPAGTTRKRPESREKALHILARRARKIVSSETPRNRHSAHRGISRRPGFSGPINPWLTPRAGRVKGKSRLPAGIAGRLESRLRIGLPK